MKNVFNHTAHKALWNWLADHPDKSKTDYFVLNNITEIPYDYCYACDYDIEAEIPVRRCCNCPLIGWGAERCYNIDGLYDEYLDTLLAQDEEEGRKVALKIANLPVKEGVETI